MPSEVVLWRIYAALKALLAAHAPLTALIGTKPVGSGAAIYDEGSVPQAATSGDAWLPYVTVGAGTQVSRDTFGADGAPKYGYSCTLQVKVVGQRISEEAGMKILSAVRYAIRPGLDLTLAGYQFAYVDTFEVFPTITTTEAGVVTRQWPAILRVELHD